MDKKEAQQVLQTLRPDDLNTDKPAVIEALVYAESDPELKAWWEAQQSFDRRVAAKLKEVLPPADLRETILGGRKIVPIAPQPYLPFWLAAAAVVAILCVAGTLRQITNFGPLTSPEFAEATLPLLNNDAPALAMTSPDHDKIMAWLKAQNAPMGTLPSKMTGLPTVGCQKYVVHGHNVSLICFVMAGGALAHLFIVDQEALTNPPAQNAPEFGQADGWSTASWSDNGMSYMLATQAGPDALKQLL